MGGFPGRQAALKGNVDLLLVPDQVDHDEMVLYLSNILPIAYRIVSYRREKGDVGFWVGHFLLSMIF